MTVTNVRKDPGSLTMEIVAEFFAPLDRVWQLISDPRQLERWWGPPTHPATFTDFDLTPGGAVAYFMTGPDGERYHGGGTSARSIHRTYWRCTTGSRTTTGNRSRACR